MVLPFLPLAQLVSPVTIVVEPDRVLNRIESAIYGACIEDVNHEIYGGLYAQRIFGESFEEPAPGMSPLGWKVIGGTWAPDGTGIFARAGDGPKLVREVPAMGDGTVEASIILANDMGENAGLLVRVSNPGEGADAFDGYEISLSAKRRQIVLGKHRHDWQPLHSVSAPVVPGRWHRMRVVLAGSRIQVFLGDERKPRIDFTDVDRPLMSGTVALRSWRADASFRDVKIDDQIIPTSFAGEGVSGMWDAFQVGGSQGVYSLEGGAFNGELCQKIVHGGGTGSVGIANRGLNRWGISVRKGHTMEGRVYLRGDGPVTVALQSADGTRTYATSEVKAGNEWSKAPFHLTPDATDPDARFALWIDRPGEVWVDQAVLLDAEVDRFHGLPVRRDIAQALVDGGYTFLRYGGSMINTPGYRWKNMIGDPDRRPPYAGIWYPCSTNGFGIFDFLRFCEAAKFGASFAINPEETPEDAADLADYLTAPVETEWGGRRAVDGHPSPYPVEYIQIGNEEAIGNPSADGLSHYAERFRLLSTAIHRRNPKIKLVCGAWWVPESPDMKTVFDAVDGVAAAWDLHFWCDEPNSGKAIDGELDRANVLFKGWNPKTNLKAVVFEENGNRHDLQRALGHATTLNATRRHGDFVLVDCAANCLQPWEQNDNGWDQGQVFFTSDHAWGMPPYDAQRILARNHLPLQIASHIEGNLDVLATKSEDGRLVALTLVNTGNDPVDVMISIHGFTGSKARLWMIAGELTAENPPKGPKTVMPQEKELTIDADNIGLSLPARSLTVVRLER